MINKDLVQKILQWRHTGFNVHSKVRTESKEETERVGKYMIRPILSLKRLSLHEGQVLYQYGNHSSERESMAYPCFRRDKPLIKSGTSNEILIFYYIKTYDNMR